MNKESCFILGRIAKAHGKDGEMVISLETENPALYKKLGSVFLDINGKLVPFSVKSFQVIKKNTALFGLEDIDEMDEAAELEGHQIFVPFAKLPTLQEGKFYYHEVIGFQIQDTNLGLLGTVKEIYEFPGQDVLAMEYNDNEVLIPLIDHFVGKADHEKRLLYTTLPDGMIELNVPSNKTPDDEDED